MISIAMATYNGELYIRQQIDSILCQTYADFELIISDDNSSDGTFRILKEYECKDNRIKVYQNRTNKGFLSNFSEAITHCRGEFIALADQDDIWTTDHLEFLHNNIGNKVLICGNSELIDKHGGSLGMTLHYQEALDYIPNDNREKALSILFWRNPYQGATMLFRKDFMDYALPIPDGAWFHDTWFALLACFLDSIVVSAHVIEKYRIHSDNVSGQRFKRKNKYHDFISHCIKGIPANDRIPMLEAIQLRAKVNHADIVEIINRFDNHTLGKRLKNTYFLINKRNLIFSGF